MTHDLDLCLWFIIISGNKINVFRGLKMVESVDSTQENDLWPVTCGDLEGHFSVSRFGPGGRSRCILHEDKWISLTQFECKAGKSSSHNWKRTIRRKVIKKDKMSYVDHLLFNSDSRVGLYIT